jgi:MYXO-CTERM domain-containing protein
MAWEGRKGFLALGAAAIVAAVSGGTADAALLSLSRVVTNTTATTQDYEFEVSFLVTQQILDAGMFGGVVVAVTDFNRNGAFVSSWTDGSFYSAFVNASRVQSFVPQGSSPTPGSFLLQAPSRGQASFMQEFGSSTSPLFMNRNVVASDIVRLKMQFRLSAGDQAAISARFDVVQMDPVPAPAAAALLAGVTLLRRRRTNKS